MQPVGGAGRVDGHSVSGSDGQGAGQSREPVGLIAPDAGGQAQPAFLAGGVQWRGVTAGAVDDSQVDVDVEPGVGQSAG